jgi:hypothetical protein
MAQPVYFVYLAELRVREHKVGSSYFDSFETVPVSKSEYIARLMMFEGYLSCTKNDKPYGIDTEQAHSDFNLVFTRSDAS